MIYFVSKSRKLWQEQSKPEFLGHIKDEHMIKSISIEQSLEMLSTYKILGLDIETLGTDCHTDKMTLLQLGGFLDQFVIDCTSIDVLNYKGILEDKNILKIGCNLKFDLQFLYKNNIWCTNVWDIMLAEFVLYNGVNKERLRDIYMRYAETIKANDAMRSALLKKAKSGWYSLLSLVFQYTGVCLVKSERENFRDYLSKSFIIYSAEDVKYLQMVYEKQRRLIEIDGCYKAVYIENGFVEVLAYIEYCGLKLDTKQWLDLYQKNLTKYNELLHQLNKWIYDNNITKYQDLQMDLFDNNDEYKTLINWQSSKQLVALFRELGLNVINKDGKVSVDDQVMSEQKDKSTLVPLLIEFSDYKKATGTYGEKFLQHINPSTGRIHPDFTQLINTSRISCHNPNLQNLPADAAFRHCFVPEEGNIICDADYSGQESVLLVNFSKEKNLISFYKNGGGDLHSYVAKLTFPDEIGDTPIEEIKAKFGDLRQISKKVEF